MQTDALVERANAAFRTGNLKHALELLEDAAQHRPDDPTLWLQIAAMHRASGNPSDALTAVHKGLAVAPLDFMGLLMRASLLQRMEDPQAGEAWGHALAQKPSGELPPQLAATVAEGERHHAAWLEARESRLARAMAGPEQRGNEEERARIARFRSNALRKTRPFHSEPTHFHFPGLVEREFHPRHLFPWLSELEGAADMIRQEFKAVMAAERAELVPYIQYDDHLPLDQWRQLNRNPDWTAIHLWQNGVRIEANANHCRETLDLLRRVPQPSTKGSGPNAMFSLLAPHTHIPAHVGVTNTRLVCHLPLIVPEGCWFRAGAETRAWRPGEAFVFDDTIEHEAMNPSDELRVVFIFDIWHPDLSEVEREAVAALLALETGGAAL
ncbi:aspartyl/asparaginyl beta-hydroxylase domain-containing protein [Sphingomonas hankyongi]|uniref:Aspartyl/asparaginyl beta-hydroxylase domain-containing protein n=1 Tax=Sphingomonas hankyongi TaxID=2908209 RepID=A0ABT0S395_9SPHN|nr:aspartyl/asparaginyl beta-hydroxylase domain-containing protein [Sphingomonas hankyongi]